MAVAMGERSTPCGAETHPQRVVWNPRHPPQEWKDDIFDAVHRGDVRKVEELLVEAERNEGETSTAKRRRGMKATTSHERVADIRCPRGATPLMWAAWHDHVDVIRVLLQHGGNLEARCYVAGGTPLIWAARNGAVEAVKFLLEKGADARSQSEIPRPRTSTWSTLQPSRQVSVLKENALMVATQYARTDVVQVLADHPEMNLEERNAYGQTVLHIAAWCGHIDLVSLLIHKGASVNTCMDDGSTPLMLAIDAGFHDVAYLLLCYGADPTLEDADGQSAITLAASQSSSSIGQAISIAMKSGEESGLLTWNSKCHELLPLPMRQQIESILLFSYQKGGEGQNFLETLRNQGLLETLFSAVLKVWVQSQ